MFPKNDKELEVHFKLQELFEAKKRSERSIWQAGTEGMMKIYQNQYDRAKTEYLKLLNELPD